MLNWLKSLFKRTERKVHPVEEAQVYAAYGRTKDAKRVLEDGLASSPDDSRILAALRELSLAGSINGSCSETPMGCGKFR